MNFGFFLNYELWTIHSYRQDKHYHSSQVCRLCHSTWNREWRWVIVEIKSIKRSSWFLCIGNEKEYNVFQRTDQCIVHINQPGDLCWGCSLSGGEILSTPLYLVEPDLCWNCSLSGDKVLSIPLYLVQAGSISACQNNPQHRQLSLHKITKGSRKGPGASHVGKTE